MPKTEIDYSNTVIYKLCCKNPEIKEIYIGHTTNFIKRKHGHKKCCCNSNSKNHNLYVYQFIRENGGWDNWSMIQIEIYNCKNKIEASIRERYWIETLNSTLNSVNPFASIEEKKQQKQNWYNENKNEILEKSKENYQENKEAKLEYQKQYAEENKEHIAEKQKEELRNRLEPFANDGDNLEEIQENREQIEISLMYERMPKPSAIAIDEFLADKVDFRARTEGTDEN